MDKKNKVKKKPQAAGSLKASPVKPISSEDVIVIYAPTPAPIPKGKEIHPRRQAPVVPKGPEREDVDPSPPTVLEDSS
jgi:hypothetical protein